MRRKLDRVVAFGTLSGLALIAGLLVEIRFRVEPLPAERMEFLEHVVELRNGEYVTVHTARLGGETMAEWVSHHRESLREVKSNL